MTLNILVLYMLLAMLVFAGFMFLIRWAIEKEGELMDKIFQEKMDAMNTGDF